MKIHNVEQGSDAWNLIRLGKVTVSRTNDLVTKGGKPSARRDAYMNELIAEVLAGKHFESFDSFAMKRGRDLEPEAADMFAFQTDLTCREVGFVTDDRERVGCSPDRLVDDVGLEIKCPGHPNHMKYLIDYHKDGVMPADYYGQVQGTMWIMNMDHYWFMSYHPDLPNMIMRVERDEEYIAGLSAAIETLLEEMDQTLDLLRRKI